VKSAKRRKAWPDGHSLKLPTCRSSGVDVAYIYDLFDYVDGDPPAAQYIWLHFKLILGYRWSFRCTAIRVVVLDLEGGLQTKGELA
jgi:hypothetical protein